MKDINWGKGVISVLASVFITVVGGLLIYFIQTKEPKLIYSFEEILPFENQNERLTIYHITIENAGDEVASEIISIINLKPATVKEYRVYSDSPLEFKDSSDSTGLRIITSSLNPLENYRVSILATSRSVFPKEPLIHVRGKGINGTKKEGNKESGIFGDLNWVKLLAIMIGGLVTTSALTLVFRRKLAVIDDDEQHRGNQREIVGYLCGLHGLNEQIDQFPRKTSYWAAMDRLTSISINNNDEALKRKVKLLISDLIEYAGIADSSIGIGYYNLARIEKSIQNDTEAKMNLEKAEKLIPKLLKTRLKLDPLFKN